MHCYLFMLFNRCFAFDFSRDTRVICKHNICNNRDIPILIRIQILNNNKVSSIFEIVYVYNCELWENALTLQRHNIPPNWRCFTNISGKINHAITIYSNSEWTHLFIIISSQYLILPQTQYWQKCNEPKVSAPKYFSI